MTLIVQSQFFLQIIPAQSHWVNILLGQKKSLPYHAGLWKQPPPLPAHPFPLQPSQAHKVVVWGGRTPKSSSSSQRMEFKLGLKTRVSEGGIYSKCSFTQIVSRQEGAAHLNIHTFLHLKTSLLYFKGKNKRPSQPFPKKPNNNNNNNKKSY